MTMRERMLAVIHGHEHDRVPFVQYDGIAAPNTEIWDLVGRDNLGVLRWSALHTLYAPNCSIKTEQISLGGRPALRNTLVTPAGNLSQERLYEPVFNTTAAHTHYVKSIADYEILIAYLRDLKVGESTDGFHQSQRDLGDDGLPMPAVMRTPYQQLWVQWVSLEDLCLHLVDAPDVTGECLELLAQLELQVFEVVYQVARREPVHFVDIPDNITAPTIGERYFRQYCLPLYQRFADMMSSLDVPIFVHMDGDLKPLWNAIAESGIRGLDSFSPPPDNDTSVAQALALWPEMRLFMNFPSSVHLAAPEAIYAATMDILAQDNHSGRLQIQISENVPPGIWRTSYPEIVRAIHDFSSRP